jgi:Zn-dependent peptidase ImmA (M78 family)
MDREQVAAVSRAKDNTTLCEVRANSFAAAFLMPEQGIGKAVLELGKGKPGRERVIIGGEVGEPVEASRRRRASDQNLAIEDVVRIAHRFGVSRIALLYRMMNLGLVNQNQFDSLKEEDDLMGSAVAQSLGLEESTEINCDSHVPDDLKSHVMELGIRAYDRELISRSKLFEVCQMVGADESSVETVIAHRGLQRKSEVAIPEELA